MLEHHSRRPLPRQLDAQTLERPADLAALPWALLATLLVSGGGCALNHWLERFEDHTDEVADMFDESFVRAWRLYLCGSIASFESGVNGLLQLVFARGDYNEVPWSRSYVYSAELEDSVAGRI